MSTFVTDSLLEKTSNNGVSVDGMKHLDGVRTHSNEVEVQQLQHQKMV